MNYVLCEWICKRCGELHRMRFKIVIGLEKAKKLKGKIAHQDCIIEDYPFDQGNMKHTRIKSTAQPVSKIYVKWNM